MDASENTIAPVMTPTSAIDAAHTMSQARGIGRAARAGAVIGSTGASVATSGADAVADASGCACALAAASASVSATTGLASASSS